MVFFSSYIVSFISNFLYTLFCVSSTARKEKRGRKNSFIYIYIWVEEGRSHAASYMNVEKETLYMYIQQCRAMKKEDHRAAVSYIYIQHTQGADKQLGLRRYLYVVVTFFIICADAKGFGSIKKKRAAIKDILQSLMPQNKRRDLN